MLNWFGCSRNKRNPVVSKKSHNFPNFCVGQIVELTPSEINFQITCMNKKEEDVQFFGEIVDVFWNNGGQCHMYRMYTPATDKYITKCESSIQLHSSNTVRRPVHISPNWPNCCCCYRFGCPFTRE